MWRPSPNPCRSMDNTPLLRTICEPVSIPTQLKKYQTFNLRSHAQFCYGEQVVLLACANSPPERYRRIHVL